MTMLVFSEKTYLLPCQHKDIKVQLGYGFYSDNDSMAILLMCRAADIDEALLEDEDYDYEGAPFEEVLCTISVNLATSGELPLAEQYIDINNYPQITRWLTDNGIAVPSGRTESNGHFLYPAYKFQIPSAYRKKLEERQQPNP